jgi:hypothetical protein
MFTKTETVFSDGNTLNEKFTDSTEARPLTAEVTSTRVSPAAAGSHAVSSEADLEARHRLQQWLTVTYQSTADGLKMADPNGESYDAKFDGKDYPVEGDPGHTMVSLKRISRNPIEEADKRDGKVGRNQPYVGGEGRQVDPRGFHR